MKNNKLKVIKLMETLKSYNTYCVNFDNFSDEYRERFEEYLKEEHDLNVDELNFDTALVEDMETSLEDIKTLEELIEFLEELLSMFDKQAMSIIEDFFIDIEDEVIYGYDKVLSPESTSNSLLSDVRDVLDKYNSLSTLVEPIIYDDSYSFKVLDDKIEELYIVKSYTLNDEPVVFSSDKEEAEFIAKGMFPAKVTTLKIPENKILDYLMF